MTAPDVNVGVHIAVMVEPYLSAILDGRKTIESRFGVHRQPPYRCVSEGDVILFKRSGGPVGGVAIARKAEYFELADGVLHELRQKFAYRLYALDDEFWEARAGKQFATLIEVEDPIAVSAFPLSKRDRRGWVAYPPRQTSSELPLSL